MRKHPEVVALAVLTLLSMAAAWRPLPGLQISSGFRQPVSMERLASLPAFAEWKELKLTCPLSW